MTSVAGSLVPPAAVSAATSAAVTTSLATVVDIRVEVGIGVDGEPIAAPGLVDPRADVTDRSPGPLPDGRLGRDRGDRDPGHDDHAGGDGPARPDQRSCPRSDPDEGSGAGEDRTQVDGAQVDGAPVEPAGSLLTAEPRALDASGCPLQGGATPTAS